MRLLVAGTTLVALAGCFRGDPAPPAKPTPDAPHPASRGRAIADPLGFLPADAEMVLVLDMKPVRASPLWARRFEPLLRQRTDQFLAVFATACKFDPIGQLGWISVGIRDLTAPNPTGAFVIRGYDREVVMKCIELAKLGDPSVIAIDQGIVTMTGTSPSAMTFVDATTLVVIVGPNANAATLRGVIDGGAPLRMTPWFSELLPKVNTKAPAWFVVDGNSKMLANTGVGQKMRGMMGSMSVDNGIAANVRMRLDGADQATRLATTVQQQIGLASGFFDELEISADEADIVVRVRATTSQIETLLGLAGVP